MIKKKCTDSFVLVFFIFLQCCFWFFITSKIKPNFTITPLPPSKTEMSIFSFGDNALLYRIYGFQLQNAGDSFGETIPLKDYDYEKLEKWFFALNELDGISNYVPAIAGFYYSASQNPSDNKYIVDYLLAFADQNPEKNWRWYITASYLLKNKLNDKNRALDVNKKIFKINDGNIPSFIKLSSLMLFTDDDLQECETIKMIADFVRNGEMEKLALDPIFSANNGSYNFLFQMADKKIKKILSNKLLLKKCLSR